MGLKRYITIMNEDNQTKTVGTDVTGLLFEVFVYNDHDTNDSRQPTIKFYFQTDDDLEITVFKKKLEVNETFILKPEISLISDDLKIYCDLKGVQVVTQVLQN